MADVQGDRAAVLRCIGHAVAAALAVAQHELDILSGAVVQAFGRWQLQGQDHHIGRDFFDAGHARWHFLDRIIAAARHHARLNDEVGIAGSTAEQRVASGHFVRRECTLLVRLMLYAAGHDLALAGTASTIFTAIRQAHAGAYRRCQHGFVRFAAELLAAGLNSHLKSHTILEMKNILIQSLHKPLGLPRLLPLLSARFRVFAVTSQPARCAELRAAGAVPIVANLDDRASLRRLAGLATMIVHLAPPLSSGLLDRRTRNLVAILPEHARLVYVSTSGVYGDCGGAWVDETRPTAPGNARAKRRVDAEQVLRGWGARRGAKVAILRVPGIYAPDRLPLKRLREGTPALAAGDDVYTNHIHADDLARIIERALWRGKPGRVYHASDDSELKMADYFDAVADTFDLPRPPRLPRAELRQVVTPMLLSFMSESRRLHNARLKRELGVRLRYARVADALQSLSADAAGIG